MGERLAELFYANWMVVVSIGLLGAMEASIESIVVVTIVAFAVNLIWGLIDGITVSYGMIITRMQQNKIIRRIQQGDTSAKDDAKFSLNDTILSVLDDSELEKIIAAIAASEKVPEYHGRPLKSDIFYAIGIVFLDIIMVFPLVLPLYLIPDYHTAVYASHMISVFIFALIGAAYAKKLKKNMWIVAVSFAVIGTILFTTVFEYGW